jgi:hypothetical protein
MMRIAVRTFVVLFGCLVLAGVLLTPSASAAAAATVCHTPFGSLAKNDPRMGTGEIDGLRVGRHDCFDRLVVDIDGPAAGYNVRYVSQILSEGQGAVVPTPPGTAKLNVVIRHPSFSRLTMPNVAGFTTFRKVVDAGSFEGQTTIGLAVRARLPFRVFVIQGGHGKIVIDVAHRWTA